MLAAGAGGCSRMMRLTWVQRSRCFDGRHLSAISSASSLRPVQQLSIASLVCGFWRLLCCLTLSLLS